MQLKILTWNIWGGKFLSEVIAFLKEADPDIILLQEVIKTDDGGNTGRAIAEALGYQAPACALDMKISSNWTGPQREKEVVLDFGNAIVSKYPIENVKPYDLSPEASRVIVSGDIKVGDEVLHVFSVHLKHNHIGEKFSSLFDDLQKEQADNLLAILPTQNVIVAGDFNGAATSEAVQKMQVILTDTDPTQAPTWSAHLKGCSTCQPKSVSTRFDYIFVSSNISSGICTVHPSPASDHLPVSVILEI
jgi:endonuclease/exonuclease/phosphatase family metal-dependent hydrolase